MKILEKCRQAMVKERPFPGIQRGWLAILLFALAVLIPFQGAAATGRTVDAKADFGAVGNGTADDTAALQNALDYLSTNLLSDAGVCLYLPAGTYKITNQLVFVAATNIFGGDFQGFTIRGNGMNGPNASVISSTGTNGALLINVNDDAILYNFKVQLQDLQFKAGAANAGAAIEVAKLTGTNIFLKTTPWLRNVEITRADTNCYFTYGFKGTGMLRAVFTDVNVTGNRPGMTCGILLTNHYGYDVSGCFFSDADVAVDSKDGGEGNSLDNTTITNVNIGVRMQVGVANVSSSGGGTINCRISAHQIGVYIDKKSFATFHNTVFSSCGGSDPYTNFYALRLRQSTIADNTFAGGTNQTGIVLGEDRVGTDNQNTIAYNQFGPFGTSVAIGTNVSLTKIIDNSNIQSNIADNGINTYIVHGAMRPFYDSPAAHDTDEDLRWNSIATNYGSVINVTNYGAKGDGVTDDTTAITNAVAALKTRLDSTGKGALYFPSGRYRTSKQLVLTQSGANWQKMAIFGDGSQVSVIEKTTGVSGIFKITCTSQVPTRIHNIRLSPIMLNSGTAFELIQQNGTNNGSRSLIMHDVLINGSGNGYFTTAIIGQGLVRPLFQSCWSDSGGGAGSSGLKISGGYGFDWQGGKFGDMTATAGSIDSLGGAVTIRGPGFCAGLNTRTGLTVNANGGTFALYRAHINALNCLVVSNASAASFALTETLWGGVSNGVPSSSLRFSNCTNIVVRDASLYSAPPTNRPLNTFIVLEGDRNRNVDISGNMFRFYDYEGTGINIAQGSTNVSVYDNRFFTFPAVDITNSEPSAAIALLPMEYRPELAGYWDLEEGTYSTVHGRNYLQQGTVSGAAWADGKYGTGLYFDGTNDSVTIDTPQFKELMTNFTLMAWVKPEKGITGGNQSGGQSYVISGASPDTNANHVSVNLSVGTNGIRVVENGVSGVPTMIDWTGTVYSAAWTHVAVTYSNSVPRLYIRGDLAATGSASAGKTPHPGGSSWGGDAWGWYKGSLDEVRVFDRPLSAAEIFAEAGSATEIGRANVNTNLIYGEAWLGGVAPGTDDVAVFLTLGNASATNSLGGDASWLGIRSPANPARELIMKAIGTETLTLGDLGINMSAVVTNGKPDVTINPNVALGEAQTWSVAGASGTNTLRTLTINGVISGSTTNSLAKSGEGTLILAGSNTYAGGTVLQAGTLTINTATALGTGIFTINGGAIDSTAATLSNANNNITVINSDFAFTGTQDLNLGTGSMTLGASNGTSRTITANGANTLTVAGTIADGSTAAQLIKDGTGTLTLTGTNTFSGGLVVKRGIVAFGKTGTTAGGDTYGAGTGAITLGDAAGGDVSLSVGSYTLTNPINLASGAAGTKTIGNGTGATRAPQFSGAIALNGNDLILSQKSTANMTVSGGITGAGNLHLTNGAAGFIRLISNGINNAGSITVSGSTNDSVNLISAAIGANVTTLTLNNSAELILSNANAYAGGTIVSSGHLTGAANGAFGTNSITVADGAALTLGGAATNYIGNAAKLILGTNSALNLAFTGTDTVGGVSLDGGATWIAAGTYNAAALTAAGGTGTYTGSGILKVTFGSYLLTGSVAGGNGTVSPTSTNVLAGSSADFMITADLYHRIAALTTNGTPAGTFDNSSTSALFTWTDVQAAGALAATFTAQVANDPASTPYWWLAQYGLTNFNSDALADTDSDGLKTWQEYIAGTNPTNPASVLKITGNSVNSQGSVIRWSSVSNRFYDLSRSTNLLAAFAAVAGASNLPATPPENAYTNSPNDNNAVFYRIRVHE